MGKFNEEAVRHKLIEGNEINEVRSYIKRQMNN